MAAAIESLISGGNNPSRRAKVSPGDFVCMVPMQKCPVLPARTGICCFIIPDFTDTNDVRIAANGRAKSCRKTFHIAPDFGLMGWQKVILSPECIPPDLHRSPFCGREIFLNVAIQCRCQCGFPGAGFSADETQTGFLSMASSRSGSIFIVRMSGISDGITRMVTEITFSSVADVP